MFVKITKKNFWQLRVGRKFLCDGPGWLNFLTGRAGEIAARAPCTLLVMKPWWKIENEEFSEDMEQLPLSSMTSSPDRIFRWRNPCKRCFRKTNKIGIPNEMRYSIRLSYLHKNKNVSHQIQCSHQKYRLKRVPLISWRNLRVLRMLCNLTQSRQPFSSCSIPLQQLFCS